MPKILLFRVAHDLNASLMSELSRAGYDVATPESADVRTVLQQQPDLILLQTDVRTLDCCGFLTQLKGNEATAPVKIILLADGGPLERSRALDLGADDVLSIPFERVELFARIRAQLREKAPDDRLRLEVLDAKRKELEAEAALAAIVTQKETGKRRWIVLAVVAALAVIGLSVAVRNALVSRKSSASLVMQLESLRSQILTQDQLLERALKSREAQNQELSASVSKQLEELRAESADLRKQISTSSGASLADLDGRLKQTDSRIGKLETDARIAQEIVRDYSNSVCLIYVIVGFRDKESGARLMFAGIDASGNPLADNKGNVVLTTEGGSRPVYLHVFGSGFLIDTAGHILTNHHVLQPWWHNEQAVPVPSDTFEPTIEWMWAYFPGYETAMPLHVRSMSEDFDLGLASVDLPQSRPRPVAIDQQAAISGSPVVLIGYPTGVEGILARVDEPTLKQIARTAGNSTEGLVQELARRKLIRPLVTQGHLGVVGPDRLVYDAQTTHGGSGGPVFDASGKVIGVNFAILSDFSGSNFAVPILRAAGMLEASKRRADADLRQPQSAR
ncbi:MAG TPA: trypsin-like peptidase domain-containing protein [Steroidobacteraceae bacterium]|nr:trypsin-like peptidase domain-containing protein [Steroidobacteraceae bacterium]